MWVFSYELIQFKGIRRFLGRSHVHLTISLYTSMNTLLSKLTLYGKQKKRLTRCWSTVGLDANPASALWHCVSVKEHLKHKYTRTDRLFRGKAAIKLKATFTQSKLLVGSEPFTRERNKRQNPAGPKNKTVAMMCNKSHVCQIH